MEMGKQGKKKYKVYNLRRKEHWERHVGAKSQGEGKFKEKPDAKWNKGSDLGATSHPAKFSTCEKELKNSLGLGMLAHTFNQSQNSYDRVMWIQLGPQNHFQDSQT